MYKPRNKKPSMNNSKRKKLTKQINTITEFPLNNKKIKWIKGIASQINKKNSNSRLLLEKKLGIANGLLNHTKTKKYVVHYVNNGKIKTIPKSLFFQ